MRACGVEACPDESIVELANGCLCCTVADNFHSRGDRSVCWRIEQRPDHIIIETSGLALPKPLVKAFDWPSIRSRLTVDGVVAVVDDAPSRKGVSPTILKPSRRAGAKTRRHRSRQPARRGLRGPTRLRRSRHPQQDRPASEQDEADVLAQMLRDVAPRATKIFSARTGRRRRALIALGLGAAAEDDLANRPSHHDARKSTTTTTSTVSSSISRRRRTPRRWSRGSPKSPRRRRPAHKGLCRNRRQADAPPCARRRRALPASLRPRLEGDEARASRLVVIGQKGIDRGRVALLLAALKPCICSLAICTDSTTRTWRSISRRRRRM